VAVEMQVQDLVLEEDHLVVVHQAEALVEEAVEVKTLQEVILVHLLVHLVHLVVVVMVDMLIEYKEYLLVLNQDIHQQVLNLLE
jgi:high-affinity K+ transport system ATPase subunit B